MRARDEITSLAQALEANICDKGWDPSVDGAATALAWVLGDDIGGTFRIFMDRPEGDRRREWIERGGNPDDWDRQEWRP